MTSSEMNILGAGGHARSVIALLERNKIGIAGVYDESFSPGTKEKISGYPLLGKVPGKENKTVLAIGDNANREKYFGELGSSVFEGSIVHPSAIIEARGSVGKANLVFAGCIINAEARLGDNNIL